MTGYFTNIRDDGNPEMEEGLFEYHEKYKDNTEAHNPTLIDINGTFIDAENPNAADESSRSKEYEIWMMLDSNVTGKTSVPVFITGVYNNIGVIYSDDTFNDAFIGGNDTKIYYMYHNIDNLSYESDGTIPKYLKS